MVVLSAGIRSLLRKAEGADLSRPVEAPDPTGEIIPEWWATSSRNDGRDHLGIGGRHHPGTTGGFIRNRQSRTARALRCNHATVARRIGNLEALFGRALFDRRSSGYVLTAVGKTVLSEASAMDEAALSFLRRRDIGTELSGLVRLAVGQVLAERFLVVRLRGFHDRYPAIDLEVIGGSRVVSLAKREADIALRYGAPKDSELVARRLATIAFGLYVSVAYRDKLRAGLPPAFIGFDADGDFIAEADKGWRETRPEL